MNIKSKLRMAATSLLMSVTCCILVCGCDSAIYDGEGDCDVHYKVRFRDNYNMKYADAFAHEVSSMTLYLIDEKGEVVWKNTDAGGALAEDGYAMDVDVEEGTYSLLAWGGTTDKGSFTIANSVFGTELTCTLNRQYDTKRNALVYSDLDGLFHGYAADVEFPNTPGTYYYTLPLVKNTNEVTVVLQQLTGEMLDANKFTFSITAANGKMDWDNSLLPDETITYYAWNVAQGDADLDWDFSTEPDEATENDESESGAGTEADSSIDSNIDSGAEAGNATDSGTDTPAALKATRTSYPSALAQITVGRLVKGQDTRLTVTNTETGETVFSIPLIDYVLMLKDLTNPDMDDQEFLDRQDSYEMTFFLDEGYRWMKTFIYINSWVIVLQDSVLN
ncbi:MAG: FimB/Mfa2 family fimbrial subunit [Prevotella sp.]|nr:FimB/Mfa2 family fimbrial subunit [Prevotella sp.]